MSSRRERQHEQDAMPIRELPAWLDEVADAAAQIGDAGGIPQTRPTVAAAERFISAARELAASIRTHILPLIKE